MGVRLGLAAAMLLMATVKVAAGADQPTTDKTAHLRNSLNILSWNVFMRVHPTKGDDKRWRATQLFSKLCGYDVIVFNEVNDDNVRTQLLIPLLAEEYPHRTKILGADRGIEQDGGVMIFSRWPILNSPGAEVHFGDVCHGDIFGGGGDCLADKGVIYARINKHGHRYHVFGTHTDAGDDLQKPRTLFEGPDPLGRVVGRELKTNAGVRQAQFAIIKTFIDQQSIPASEPVFIAGDLNVDRWGDAQVAGKGEFEAMLETLDASLPFTLGHRYTVDEQINPLARGRKHLDYILISNAHLRPIDGGVETFTPKPASEGLGAVPPRCKINLDDDHLQEVFAEEEDFVPGNLLSGVLPDFVERVVRQWLARQKARRLDRSVSDHFPVFGQFFMPSAAGIVATQSLD